MFTIMENRKRPRLEVLGQPAGNDCLQGVATTNALGSATLATIGGQSFILSNAGSGGLPANILLSICDDNSDESEEYIIDSSVLQQIKQENSVSCQTTATVNTQPQLLTTVPQYRIINQPLKSSPNNHNNNNNNVLATTTAPAAAMLNATANTNSTLIPTSMQLSSGCEIYVIKEVIEPPKQLLADTAAPPKKLLHNNSTTTTTIKLEPMSPTPAPAAGSIQVMRSAANVINKPQLPCIAAKNCHTTVLNSNTAATIVCDQDDPSKRSLILEAYKKRDDKRRATHNEVERRRRDKINSWIFKLKEMLPADLSSSAAGSPKDTAASVNVNATSAGPPRLLMQQQGTTQRTPPSDSKSQILIKACEYIKTMQEEIESLRECLTENENLRLSNQRLQEELSNLRCKQQRHQLTLSNNSNSHPSSNSLLLGSNSDDECELTLNSLNTTYANVQLFSPGSSVMESGGDAGVNTTQATSGSGLSFAKRELVITDYVD